MLASFLFVAATVAAAPAPAATSAPGALKEIGHVRATAACAELATHANSAISKALNNDLLLTQTITKLHSADLDGDEITRHNNLEELGRLAKDLRAQAVSGDSEVRRLRDIAAKSTDPKQKKELKEFADQLGGALYRQKKVANDLNGLLAAFDYHGMAKMDENQRDANEMAVGNGPPEMPDSSGSTVAHLDRIRNAPKNPTDSKLAINAAADFELRLPDITNDEANAASHIEGAVSGC
ncbi:MAG: hypothetical protein DLM50_04255 [Candidatus Meridianibacter frigidus]|nr:MAG: hypothetical protein DLM50_04255 [Candidatus Eremiobacteraeota bacterium]